MKVLWTRGALDNNGVLTRLPSWSWARVAILWLGIYIFVYGFSGNSASHSTHVRVKAQRKAILEQCKYIATPAGPPPDFNARTRSDRFVPGTKAVLLKNAKVWTGARNGTEVVYGDVFLDNGLIKAVGYIPPNLTKGVEIQVHDVQGAWVTPGLVDLHSHIGVDSAPKFKGAMDTNSHQAPILPWLRSIDAINTHDASYELAMSGGVTTAQILPGSANNIGGQAFLIKLRATKERSTNSKVLEPPYNLNGSIFDHNLTPRWRHMKHACGENPDRVYSQVRMDAIWNLRQAYDEARELKAAQDTYCAKVEAGLWGDLDLEVFPEDLQWESLVDVLRGKVKLSVHCYESVDLDSIVRLSNEFKFPVASFHHAAETYLVPDLLKQTWGGVPAIALFASDFKKKREAYRGSEFAPRILADHGIPVVMKSDHPVVNSRYLLYEAAQAHYYGLNPALAMASVTSTPANAAGIGHRIGTIQEGYDADLVIWDSHPLALGATPTQVYIDGIPQLTSPYISAKPESFQAPPKTPNFDHEAQEAVEYDGEPPLEPRTTKNVAFINVKSIYTRSEGGVKKLFDEKSETNWRTVVVRDGRMTCMGGSLAPGLTSFGSPLGLVEIRLESSTNDGSVYDPLTDDVPPILGDDLALIRAVDGLQFGGRNALLAYRGGVTTAVTAPSGTGFLRGLSVAFSVASRNAVQKGAVVQAETALHIAFGHSMGASVSTQIATLRQLLLGDTSTLFGAGASQMALQRVLDGTIPLVVDVENADIMATLIALKSEYEHATSHVLRLTFAGATEAHLLADEIANAGVSVILSPARPFPHVWEQRRILPGPPLSYDTAVTALLERNVTVAIGVDNESYARNVRFDIAWAALESNGRIDMEQAIALASENLDRALGLNSGRSSDLVAYAGGDILDLDSKVVGIISESRETVDLF